MTNLYLLRVTPLEEERTREHYLPTVSPFRREKVERFQKDRAKAASLGAGMLLRWALFRRGIDRDDTVTDSWGRPWAAAAPSLYLSLSHSGEYAVCALGDEPLGVDVQQIGPLRPGVLKRFYSEKEREMVADAPEKEREFARIWARKESYVKALGRGLSMPLDSFEICHRQGRVAGDDAWKLKSWALPGHELAFCGIEPPEKIERMEWDEYESICRVL